MVSGNEKLIRDAIQPKSSDSNDGIELTNPDRAQKVGFEDIGKRKRKKRQARPVDMWVPADFVSYSLLQYRSRFGADWDLSFSASCQQIQMVSDSLVDVFGYCTNVMLKEYIDFFFQHYIDYFIQKSGGFFFSQMRKNWVIDKFIANRNQDTIEVPQKNNISPDHGGNQKNQITEKDISEVWQLGKRRLLLEYGIVISINWLIKKQEISVKDAVKQTFYVFKTLKQQQRDNVLSVTEKMSPYPDNLPYSNKDQICRIFSSSKKMSIVFSSNIKQFTFLSE